MNMIGDHRIPKKMIKIGKYKKKVVYTSLRLPGKDLFSKKYYVKDSGFWQMLNDEETRKIMFEYT